MPSESTPVAAALCAFAPPPMTRRLVGVGAIGVVVLLWWLATLGAGAEDRLISPVILPSPAEVIRSFPSLLNERALLQSIAATLKRVLIGFGLATVVGVPLGILAGSWRVARGRRRADRAVRPQPAGGRADSADDPLVRDRRDAEGDVHLHRHACRSSTRTPSPRSPACPIATSRRRRRWARRRCRSCSKVLVALALPDIYNSLRHLFGLAFGYIMLAELINAQHGLGYLLMTSQRRGLSEHIILILIIIGLLAYGIDRLLFWFQRGLFPYRVVED